MRTLLRFGVLVSSILMLLAATGGAFAQQYPARPIRIVVSVPPGGAVDVAARLLGQKMSESMGQPVVVENRVGANGIVAAEAVARAPADGYTLLLALDFTMTLNQFLYSKLPYDPVKDFAPISMLYTTTLLIVTHVKAPFRTLPELLAYAKSNPGKLNYGAGTSFGQIAGELFKSVTGADIVYVPFKAADPTVQALIRGDIDFVFGSFASALTYVRQGTLLAIATTGAERSPILPDVATMKELGYPSVEVGGWTALYAPAGLPGPIVDRLNREVVRIMKTPDVGERLQTALSNIPATSTPSELAARQKADTAKWAPLVKKAGIKAN